MMEKVSYRMIEENHVSGYEVRIGHINHKLPTVTSRLWTAGTPGKWRRISAYDLWPKIPLWSRPGTCFFIPDDMPGAPVYEIDRNG